MCNNKNLSIKKKVSQSTFNPFMAAKSCHVFVLLFSSD